MSLLIDSNLAGAASLFGLPPSPLPNYAIHDIKEKIEGR
jgi:hypothetical protein